MAGRVTHEDIKVFNELYYKYKNFAQVARETGFSAGTVSKYIDRNWAPVQPENIKKVGFDAVQKVTTEEVNARFRGIENYGDLCVLTDEEKKEMEVLWAEMAV